MYVHGAQSNCATKAHSQGWRHARDQQAPRNLNPDRRYHAEIHDTLIAACDVHRYRQLGAVGHHDNCTDNLALALDKLGLAAPRTPSPLKSLHERAGDEQRCARFRAASQRRRAICNLPCGNGLDHCVFCLSSGHDAGERYEPHRRSFPDHVVRPLETTASPRKCLGEK